MSLRKLNVLDRYGDIFPLILTQQIRYNNRHRIHNEDLAQHSYMVAYNIIKIAYDYSIEDSIRDRAVAMAITHDFSESYTADLPHDCKVAYPELKTILDKIEKEFIHNEAPELEELFLEYSNNDNLACKLVSLGDAISVLQYVNREQLHGNTHKDIDIIKNEVSLRIVKLFEDLEKSLKKEMKKNDK